MYSFRILLSVLIFMAGPFLTSANSSEECSELSKGFERATCYLNNELIDSYFEHVESYYSEVKDEGNHDPALGFQIIESVARYEKHEYADLATEIYYWGLQADKVKPYKKWIERELNYLSVLLPAEEKKEFYELLERQDPEIYEKIRRYWKSKDMILSNNKNERLLEHWDRIIYSKENFTKNDTTVFGTDERGIIYVRFGEPNRIRNGQFGSSNSEVRAKLYDLQDRGFISSSGSVMHTMQQDILTSVIPAEYELWFYNDISQRDNEYIFFLFGRKEGSGSFGLRNSVEEFIPQEVFSRALGSRSSGNDIRIGNFLQFMYYNDLSTAHTFFGNRLVSYDRAWREAMEGSRINAGYLRNNISRERAQAATENIYNAAPEDISMYERRFQNLEMDILEYRFFDEIGDPEQVFIVSTSPQIRIGDYGFSFVDLGQTRSKRIFDIHLRQGIFHYNQDYEKLDDNYNQITQSTDGEIQVSQTSHVIPIDDSLDNYSVAFSELYYSEQGNENNPAAWSLIGVNKYDTRLISPLEYEPGELVISDLVMGSPEKELISVRGKDIGILENGNRIKLGDNFQIFFEIYGFEGRSNYEVEYRIKSTSRRWLLFSSSTQQSLVWEATSQSWSDYQFFEVETMDRKPGDYELQILVTEKNTGRMADRSIEFELID